MEQWTLRSGVERSLLSSEKKQKKSGQRRRLNYCPSCSFVCRSCTRSLQPWRHAVVHDMLAVTLHACRHDLSTMMMMMMMMRMTLAPVVVARVIFILFI